jgi:L-threonylcarbamoyladenylate synthase
MVTPCRTETQMLPANAGNIANAAVLLRAGELVVFPTETVYGLGANAMSDAACANVFAVKERPRFNPLIVHVIDWDEAKTLAHANETADQLARQFWPGGLTLVLPRKSDCPVSLLASAGLDTIALRSPAHDIARALIKSAGVPVAAPSANRAGRISPTSADAVWQELNHRVPMILNGGECAIGIESTVIGFTGGRPVMLRPGAVPRSEIERIAGPLAVRTSDQIAAPGMIASHYAPSAVLRLNALELCPDEALLAFGPNAIPGARHVCNLSPGGNLHEAAANLFSMLRRLDNTGVHRIAVMPIPNTGLGEAINDRLSRAAAPRDAA